MKYSKKPLTFATQIEILKNRGLHFGNEDLAKHYLSNISYYRLMDESGSDYHGFVKPTI